MLVTLSVSCLTIHQLKLTFHPPHLSHTPVPITADAYRQCTDLPDTGQKFRIASLCPRHLFLVRDEICSSHLSHHEYAVRSIMCDCTWLSRRGITDKCHPFPLNTHSLLCGWVFIVVKVLECFFLLLFISNQTNTFPSLECSHLCVPCLRAGLPHVETKRHTHYFLLKLYSRLQNPCNSQARSSQLKRKCRRSESVRYIATHGWST